MRIYDMVKLKKYIFCKPTIIYLTDINNNLLRALFITRNGNKYFVGSMRTS